MTRYLRRRWFPWAVYGAAILLLGPLAVLAYTAAPQPDGTTNCGGIGFGEVPCGWDAVALLFIFLGAPYVAGYAFVLGLSEVAGARFTVARSVLAFVGLCVPWAGVAYLAATN